MDDAVLFLEHMTWPEVERALAGGWTTAVVPCGAVEQHGPHLPLFMDAEHGTRLGAEVARRLGSAIVAPTIRVGCSRHHMDFAGSLTLRESTFVAVCEDYCASLAHHGFTRVCMLPTHGGNFAPLDRCLDALNEAAGPGCTVEAYTDLMGLMSVWRDAVARAGGPVDHVGGHADVAETSLMMLMHPDLVRSELATAGFTPEPVAEAYRSLIEKGLRASTPTGILGDARGSSARIGEHCLAAVADAVAARFEGGTGSA